MKSMKVKYILPTICLVGGVCLTACDDYLSEAPSKNEDLEIETVEQLEALIAKDNLGADYSEFNKAALYSSDNFEISEALYAAPKMLSEPSLAVYQYNTWQMELAADDPNDSGWGDYFEHVYNANLILDELDRVSGTPEAKARLRAEGHFIRAYNYLTMANIYCMPYGPQTKNEPGLPIKRTTGFEENLRRVSLEDTYAFIESDILKALKIDVPLYRGDLRRVWRANKAAAYALAARFYLFKGEYKTALGYADQALQEDAGLIDYTSGRITQEMSFGMDEMMEPVSIMFPSTWNKEKDELIWCRETDMYYQKTIMTMWDLFWLVPSNKLLGLYDSDYDLRYRYFIVPNYSYFMMVGGCFPGYCMFKMEETCGPSVAEMLLIKAECLARIGEDIPGAMNALNTLREKRFDTSAPGSVVHLSATSREEAIRYVLEERSREMPFTMRWLDIRRCNFNDDPSDDITVTKHFYEIDAYGVKKGKWKEYRLTPQSRRYAVPIPQKEVIASDGVIEQNRY